jgi:hypothetical protein
MRTVNSMNYLFNEVKIYYFHKTDKNILNVTFQIIKAERF